MQEGQRHVLTLEEPHTIHNVLNMLSAGVRSEGSVPSGTCKMLEEIAKEGCSALILNLRVTEEALAETLPKIRNFRVSLVGGVLVVACLVTTPLMLQIRELSRRHFFARPLTASLGAVVRAFS